MSECLVSQSKHVGSNIYPKEYHCDCMLDTEVRKFAEQGHRGCGPQSNVPNTGSKRLNCGPNYSAVAGTASILLSPLVRSLCTQSTPSVSSKRIMSDSSPRAKDLGYYHIILGSLGDGVRANSHTSRSTLIPERSVSRNHRFLDG